MIISSKKKENCSGGEAVRRKNEQRKDTCLAEKVREMLQPVEQIEKFLLELGVTYI